MIRPAIARRTSVPSRLRATLEAISMRSTPQISRFDGTIIGVPAPLHLPARELDPQPDDTVID